MTKHTHQMKALVINNHGIGNGIIALPLFRRLEKAIPGFQFWHIKNEVLECSIFRDVCGIRGYSGHVPNIWRRFADVHHDSIMSFVKSRGVSLFINLRLAPLDRESDYIRFKRRAVSSGVECWDLYEGGNSVYRQPVGVSMDQLLDRRRIPREVNHRFPLQPLAKRERFFCKTLRIGFYLGASRAKKLWDDQRWSQLAEKALYLPDVEIVVFAGRSKKEKVYASRVVQEVQRVGRSKICLVMNLSLPSLAQAFGSCHCLITHDTFASHLACLMGIPTVTLFLSTVGSIWGPRPAPTFIGLQSKVGVTCRLMQSNGTCAKYYRKCKALCCHGVFVSNVYAALVMLLSCIRPGYQIHSSGYYNTKAANVNLCIP